MKISVEQRIKTEICEVQNINNSASKRFYLNSNSKSTERVHKMNKSNENVLQLINLWNQNKNSLSIQQKSIPEMKRQTTQVSLHQDQDNIPDQFLIHKVYNNSEKSSEIQESQENKSTIHQEKPKQTIANYIKNNSTPANKFASSQKENRKSSRNKPENQKLKKNSEFQNLIQQLQDVQKSINNVYKNDESFKKIELQKKIQAIIFLVEKDIR